MTTPALCIGVMANAPQVLGDLTRLVQGAGFQVSACVELQRGLPDNLPAADVWVVNIDLHEDDGIAIVERLDGTGIPIIFDDDIPAAEDRAGHREDTPTPAQLREQRQRRLAAKIRQLIREPNETPLIDGGRRAQHVWVLGASTGGPEAVVEFLDSVPAHVGGVALLYVQHTEQQAMANLRRVIAKHSTWPVLATDTTQVIRERCIYVVSASHQIELLDSGVISPSDEHWGGRFKPSIDQVIAKVARTYGNRGGAIVFSGMGSDGANSCTLLHHRGGQVWIQSSASCAVDSMPVSVERTGCAQFSACPKELGERFTRLYQSGAPEPPKPTASGNLH